MGPTRVEAVTWCERARFWINAYFSYRANQTRCAGETKREGQEDCLGPEPMAGWSHRSFRRGRQVEALTGKAYQELEFGQARCLLHIHVERSGGNTPPRRQRAPGAPGSLHQVRTRAALPIGAAEAVGLSWGLGPCMPSTFPSGADAAQWPATL